MKKNLIIWIFMVFASISYAQNTGVIKGKIIEQATKQPIVGATVILKDTMIGAASDTAGVFVIKNVPEGTHTITISILSFQQKLITDIIVVRNKTYYLETELLDDVRNLDEVVVTTFKNENNPMTPVSSYSFGREEIFRNPGAQGDIFRAIGILPGVSSAGGQFSAIAVRGQGVRDNVYMVDDIPMFEVSHLAGNGSFNDPNGGRFSIFAPRTIDNATFQGGGFAAQYGRKGSSYLGLGIKEGNQETPSLSGQFDLLGATLIYDGPSYLSKKTSVFATARYQNFSQLVKVIGLKGVGLISYGDYMLKTTTQLNLKNKLSFVAMYNPEDYERSAENIKEVDTVQDISIGTSTSNKMLFGLNLRTLTGKDGYWKNIIYFRGLKNNTAFGHTYPKVDANGVITNKENLPFQDDIATQKNNQREIGYRSIFTKQIKKDATLTAGLDLARVNLDYSRNLSQNDTSYTYTKNDFRPDPSQKFIVILPQYFNATFKDFAYNASCYVDFSFKLSRRLTLNPGVRYDYTGFTEQNTLSPRLSGSIDLTEKQTINFATGIFYQDPLFEDAADQPSNSKLENEKTTQYILGYKNYIFQDLKLIVETWYKQFDDLVLRPQSGQVLLNNNGTGHAYGADFNVTKRLSKKYYGQLGYSYMQSKRHDHDGNGEYDFTYSQPHIFSILASYQPNNKWTFSTKFRYAKGRPKDTYVIHDNVLNDPNYIRYSQEIIGKNADRLEDYISWDVRVDYRAQIKKTTLTFFIDIVNLLNRFNQSSQSFQPLTGEIYYDGLAIFPSFGLRIEI
ncbi:MAG TPA: TonB-dependent receptor [Cyclobacteriaceae bacterium]